MELFIPQTWRTVKHLL